MAHRKGIIRYQEDPFLNDNTITTRKKRITVSSTRKAVLDLDTGELEDTAEIVKVSEVDNDQFVKLFTQNLKTFFDLTPTTMKILQVLLVQMQKQPNTDKVMLNVNIAQTYFLEVGIEAMSKASFHRSVKELLDKSFIAETVLAGLFFINPTLFFNGDRVRFVNEIKRKKNDMEYSKLTARMKTAQIGQADQESLKMDDPTET